MPSDATRLHELAASRMGPSVSVIGPLHGGVQIVKHQAACWRKLFMAEAMRCDCTWGMGM
jgi:hypothetical protein